MIKTKFTVEVSSERELTYEEKLKILNDFVARLQGYSTDPKNLPFVKRVTTSIEDVTDLEIVKYILPDHYTCTENGNSIYCESSTGIDEKDNDQEFNQIVNNFKEAFGDRFQEVYHVTCTNHLRFNVYIRNLRLCR